jgi:phage terminase large subunit
MVAQAVTSVDRRSHLRVLAGGHDDRRRYSPRGGPLELFFALDPEVLIEGPAGTGKSLACLKRLDRNAVKYPGSRQLVARKTRASLTQTTLVTFERKVIVPGGRVRFHTTLQAYLYPNGSQIVVGGLDKSSKVMSSDYDTIYVSEAIELLESDAEDLTTRLRHGVIPHQQLLMDCNPGPPSHWLNRRCEAKKTRRILSRHEDNPTLWDDRCGDWTAAGVSYIAKLDALSGVRYDRLRLGLWRAAEGQVYDRWDPRVHLVDDLDPKDFRRKIGSADWGYTNPAALQVWGVDGDDRMGMLHETYRTRETIDWLIGRALVLKERYGVERWFCDPSEPGFIEQFRQAGLNAEPAINDVLPGIDAVQRRLVVPGDGRPRLVIARSAMEDIDTDLLDRKQPVSTAEEIESYVWSKRADGLPTKEKPVDAYNHGCDAMRYAVMGVDGGPPGWADMPNGDDLGAFLLEAGVA